MARPWDLPYEESSALTVVRDQPGHKDLPGMKPSSEPLALAMDGPYQQVRTNLDRVLQVTKTAVDVPQAGETPRQYECRLTSKLMKHCTSYQPMARLDKLAPDLFRNIQRTVVAEALQKPAREGTLAPFKYKDQTGRVVTEYVGSMSSWMDQFKITHGWRGPIVIADEPRL